MSSTRPYFKLTVATLCLMACSCVFTLSGVFGSGVVETEMRDVGNFTAIELIGSGRVEVTIGELQPIMVTTDDNLLPLIATTVTNGRLVVRRTRPIGFNSGLTVQATVPDLTFFSVDGSGKLLVEELDNDILTIRISGSGNATASGQTGQLTVNIAGSGKILAEDLVATDVGLNISGSGNATVNAVENLDVTISGSGSVRYLGNPQISQNISGSGSISSLE